MTTDNLLIRGKMHDIWCEDAQFHIHLPDNLIISAVMDGCSSGKESHFASFLLVKLLGKICDKIIPNGSQKRSLTETNLNPKEIGFIILENLFKEIKIFKEQLKLETIELLSTLLLAVYNSTDNRLWINISGDGYYSVNNHIKEIDQNNMPDYMAYHLDKNFDYWFNTRTASFYFSDVESYAIATDGISKYFYQDFYPLEDLDTIRYLLNTETRLSLRKKHQILCSKHKLIPYDDISIIIVKPFS